MAIGGRVSGAGTTGLGKGLLLPLLLLMTLCYILLACLAGYLFNRFADGKSILGTPTADTPLIGNTVAFWMVFIVLISSMVGIASCIIGWHYTLATRFADHNASGNRALAWAALTLNLLALGIAAKTLERGGLGGGKIGKIVKTVAAFQIIVTFFQLLYTLLVYTPTRGNDDGYNHNRNASPAGITGTGMGMNTGVKHTHTTAGEVV
jgi:hypothetical protein